MFMHPKLSAFLTATLLSTVISLPSLAIDFVHEVAPILKAHCSKCHTGEKKKGGLAMNTRAELLKGGENGKAVIPGNSAKSLMIELITSKDDEEWMPSKGDRVPAAEIAILKKWIDSGMQWEPGFSFGETSWEPPLKPRTVSLPPAKKNRNHPIDRLLDANLKTIPARTSDAMFLRRETLDITGLLPTPNALSTFLKDSKPNKRKQVIASLLKDDIAYADHWLTMWNDLLRNDYTGTGFITGGRKKITPWLYKSLRENKPYDQLARELLAPTKESAGFIDGIKWRGTVNASQSKDIQFAQNISQVFLGINMKCASCHDSFIDRWTLEEAYNLAAVYSDTPLELTRCDKPIGKMATAKWLFPELGDIDAAAPKAERLKQLAGLMTHPDNGRFTRTIANRLWHRLMGRGIVHPVDAMHTRPWNEELLDYLATRFAKDNYDIKTFIAFIMASEAYQSQTVVLKEDPGSDYAYAGPVAKRMTAEQFLDTVWQITKSNPTSMTAKIDRSEEKAPPPKAMKAPSQTPTPISAKWIWPAGPTANKASFKKLLTLSSLPPTALTKITCDNAFTMTVNGKTVASSKEWNKPVSCDIAAQLKTGINTIEIEGEMFGGSAGLICQIEFIDGKKKRVVITDKTWLARKPDENWQAAAELHSHGAGPWGAILSSATAAPSKPKQGPQRPIRAALVKNDFLMRSLGRPHRDQVVTTRPAELTTLQAIDLSNGSILADTITRGAKHLAATGKTNTELIRWLYQYALSREPTANEAAILVGIAGTEQTALVIEDVLWPIFMLPEFQIIR